MRKLLKWAYFCLQGLPDRESVQSFYKQPIGIERKTFLAPLFTLKLVTEQHWLLIFVKREKRGHSQCGISSDSLGGRSALVYSVQLNKLECQEHNASSILQRKNLSILKPVEVLSSPLLVAISMHTHRAPLRPHSLRNKTEENTLSGRGVREAKFQEFLSSSELCFNLSWQGSWRRKRQARLSETMWRNVVCAGASPGHICRQVSLMARSSSPFVTYINVPLGFHVY